MKSYLLMTTAAIAAITAIPAHAQDASASKGKLQEVVVTAERRATNIQKTAVAITAVSGAEIKARNLLNVGDVLQQTPAVVVQNSTKGQAIFIRGVGSTGDSQQGGDPAVNFNIDGVYQQQAVVSLLSAFDIARVEVLRGPQGTLYGRNANAGDINVITNDAVLNKYAAYLMAEVGNYGTYRTEAMGNIPVTDTLAVRVAVATDHHDGYLSNGSNADDSVAGRIKLLYQPSQDLKIRLTGDYGHQDGTPEGTVPVENTTGNPWYSKVVPGVQNVRVEDLYGQVDYATPIGTLTLLPSLSHTNYYQDSELLTVGAAAQQTEETAKSVEARLTSLPESTVKWVGGLYYYDASDKPTLLPAISIDATHNATTSFPALAATQFGATSYAAFGQATVPVTSRFRVTGGLRYTIDQKNIDYDYQTAATSFIGGPNFSHTWDAFTYKGGVEYDLTPTSMAYAQIANGFKAGGFNSGVTSGYLTYAPEKILSYEGGIKNRFLENTVQANLSAFYYNYDHYQASISVPSTTSSGGFANEILNAATAKIYGVEAQTVFAITPADKLTVDGSYLNAHFGTFAYKGSAGYVDNTNGVLPNAPKWSGSVEYQHTFLLDTGAQVGFLGDLRWSTSYVDSIDGGSASDQGAYTRSDAALTYTSPNTRWNVRLYVRNIENKAQRLFTLAPAPALAAIEVSDPRTYGAAVAMNF